MCKHFLVPFRRWQLATTLRDFPPYPHTPAQGGKKRACFLFQERSRYYKMVQTILSGPQGELYQIQRSLKFPWFGAGNSIERVALFPYFCCHCRCCRKSRVMGGGGLEATDEGAADPSSGSTGRSQQGPKSWHATQCLVALLGLSPSIYSVQWCNGASMKIASGPEQSVCRKSLFCLPGTLLHHRALTPELLPQALISKSSWPRKSCPRSHSALQVCSKFSIIITFVRACNWDLETRKQRESLFLKSCVSSWVTSYIQMVRI